MSIQLPGYKPLVENAVYARDIAEEGQPEITSLILPKRYTLATEDQVVSYLQQRINAVIAERSLIPGLSNLRESLLERSIKELPDDIMTGLVGGDEDCIEFIRKNTQAPITKLPEQHLLISYGILPTKTIKELGNIKNADLYNEILSQEQLKNAGLGEKWCITLLYNGTLPEKAEVDILLKHQTHASKTLNIDGIRCYHHEIREVIESIYAGLSAPEKIDQLPDISQKILEGLTLQPVIALNEYLAEEASEEEQQIPNSRPVLN